MSGRIRGHYRIDSKGRVEPLGDVNGGAIPYTLPIGNLKKQASARQLRLHRFMQAGVVIAIAGAVMVAALPKIERAIVSSQSARMAQARANYIQDHPALRSMLRHHRARD